MCPHGRQHRAPSTEALVEYRSILVSGGQLHASDSLQRAYRIKNITGAGTLTSTILLNNSTA
jgi:hypothetical protein